MFKGVELRFSLILTHAKGPIGDQIGVSTIPCLALSRRQNRQIHALTINDGVPSNFPFPAQNSSFHSDDPIQILVLVPQTQRPHLVPKPDRIRQSKYRQLSIPKIGRFVIEMDDEIVDRDDDGFVRELSDIGFAEDDDALCPVEDDGFSKLNALRRWSQKDRK